MKVLHVIPSLCARDGGPVAALQAMESSLAARGLEVVTCTSDDDGPGRRVAKPLGIPLHENGVVRLYFRKRTDFYKYTPSLARWLRVNIRRHDVVHIHALFSHASMAAAREARLAGVPYVLRPLGSLEGYGMRRRAWIKRWSLAYIQGPALRDAAAVHFTSEAERVHAGAVLPGLKGTVIPLGIATPAPCAREVLDEALPALRGRSFLLFLSRIDPKKNLEGLLRAFTGLGPTELQLLVAGDGNPAYVAKMRALADSLDIGDRVVWAGRIESSVKDAAFTWAQAFVLPSHSENFGIAAAEALAAGLPCVLGSGVALAAGAQAEGAALVVEPDPASILTALRNILGDEALRAQMGAAAARYAGTRFSCAAMAGALDELYRRIVPSQ